MQYGTNADCYFFTGNTLPSGPYDEDNPDNAYSITNDGTFSFKLEGNRSTLITFNCRFSKYDNN